MQWLGHDLTLKWKQNLSRTFNIKKSNAKVDTYMCMYQIIYWSQIDLLWQCWKRKTAASTVTIVTRLLRWRQPTGDRSAQCKGQDGCCALVVHCLKCITVVVRCTSVKRKRKLWDVLYYYTRNFVQSSQVVCSCTSKITGSELGGTILNSASCKGEGCLTQVRQEAEEFWSRFR